MCMKLYQAAERFYEHLFESYAAVLVRRPLVFILLSVLITGLCSIGLVRMTTEDDLETLYTPTNSRATVELAKYTNTFAEVSKENFFEHQLTDRGIYADIMIRAAGKGNVLEEREAIAQLIEFVEKNVSFVDGNETLDYGDVCSRRLLACALHGDVVRDDLFWKQYHEGELRWPNMVDPTGFVLNTDLSFVLGEVELNETDTGDHVVGQARVVHLRFFLKQHTDRDVELGHKWEKAFMERANDFANPRITFVYDVSSLLSKEMASMIFNEAHLAAIMFILMVGFASWATFHCDPVQSGLIVSAAGVLSCVFAAAASIGFLSACGVPFIPVVGVMPFLIVGIGVDDMFIILASFEATDSKLPYQDRIIQAMKHCGVSITITSLTDAVAFGIGMNSPFLVVRYFCAFTGLAVLFCYLFQLMFFGGFMVYHARRIEQKRHSITCRVVAAPEEETEEKRPSCCNVRASTVVPYLFKVPVKVIVIVAFIAVVAVSVYGVTQTEEGLSLADLVPDDSVFAHHLQTLTTSFPLDKGPPVAFVIDKPVAYWNPVIQADIDSLLLAARNESRANHHFQLSWLQAFAYDAMENGVDISTEEGFVPALQLFLQNQVLFTNDVVIANGTIMASRFYIQLHSYTGTIADARVMLRMRELAAASPLPVYTFSNIFIYYEQYLPVLPSTVQTLLLALAAMLVIGLIFMPQFVIILFVLATMVLIMVGLLGFMHFWDVTLSAISMIQLVMSVGFCVDFSAHIAHAFMKKSGTRDERAIGALKAVGIPILKGATSSIVGVLALAFSKSYLFRSFFKMMFILMLLGALYAVLFLPIVFSLIGPRRSADEDKQKAANKTKPYTTTPATAEQNVPLRDTGKRYFAREFYV